MKLLYKLLMKTGIVGKQFTLQVTNPAAAVQTGTGTIRLP